MASCLTLRRRLLGKRCREERGQALPLAALGALVLALGVLSTANLTQAVHERIKLQNAADSAAYTLAAQEARTFNYIAFLNRAQIAHYNTAMMVQSYITWTGFQIGVFAAGVDMLSSLRLMGRAWQIRGRCLPKPTQYSAHYCVPLNAGMLSLSEVVSVFNWMGQALRTSYRGAETMAHALIAAIQIFNRDVVWKTQASRALLMNVNLLGGVQGYVEKNDPDLAAGGSRKAILNTVITSALNAFEYYQAFDRGSGVNPSVFSFFSDLARVGPGGALEPSQVMQRRNESHETAPEVEAYRVMAELCNATRWPGFVSNRMAPRWNLGFGGFLPFASGSKRGQTLFVEQARIEKGRVVAIREGTTGIGLGGKPGNEGGGRSYPLGTVLASDDFVDSGAMSARLTLFPLARTFGLGDEALGDAIAAYDDPEGLHKRYEGSAMLAALSMAMSLHELVGSDLSFETVVQKAGEKFGDLWDQAKDYVTSGEWASRAAEFGLDKMVEALGPAGQVVGGAFKAVASGDVLGYLKNLGTAQLSQVLDRATAVVQGAVGKKVLAEVMAKGPRSLGGAVDDAELEPQDENHVPWQQRGDDPFELGRAMNEAFEGTGVSFDDREPRDTVQGDLGVAHADGPTCSGPECHAWWPGFAPYFTFNASSDRTRDFNQPSTWVFLTKYHKDFGRAGRARTSDTVPVKFSWRQAGRQAMVDLSPGAYASSFPFEGFNAVARGMAYYHRPGTWVEQPNFFNPFWRARLAPVAQRLQALWEGYVGGNISTSADNMVARGLLNVLRNAQMDLFTAAVTTLCTH